MSSHGWEHDMLSDLSPDKTKTQEAPTVLHRRYSQCIVFPVSVLVMKVTNFDISPSYLIP